MSDLSTIQRVGGNAMVVQPGPFSAARIDACAPPGSTISQAILAAGLPTVYGAHVRVWVDDWEVPRHLWATARPKAGRVVYIKVYPLGGGGGSGGGKNPLATVLSLAVMIAAPGIGSAIAGSMGLGTIATIGSYTLTWGTVIGFGVSMVGNMLINSLIGPPAPSQQQPAAAAAGWGQSSPSYQLTGSSNQYKPYAPIPRVLGKRENHHPLLAAKPYTESQGSDRYIRMLLLAGYGPLKISDLRIGQTPISAFSGVEVEINEGGPAGWAGNKDITLYTKAIREDSLSVELTQPGGWQTRTTRADTTEISVDVSFSRGLISYAADGSRVARTVELQVQYRKVGDVTWLSPTWSNASDAGMSVPGTITATEATQSTAMRGGHWFTGEAAQYEVRVARITATGGDRDVDNSTWTALRSIQSQTPVRQTNVCTIAIRIKASEQLNGVPDTINCTAEAYHEVWNGSSWAWALTRNPAWECTDLLRRRGGENLLADSRLDLDSWMSFAAACDAAPPNGTGPYWTYDGVIEGGSIYSAMHTVLAHGRASPTMRDGKHSVVIDAAQTVPAQHISPRNSWGYSGSKKFIDLPHALHVKFTNPERGSIEDTRTVYADGYDENTATRFEQVEYFGCTRSDQAWRIGRYLLAVGQLRPEEHTVFQDIESLRCTRGDLVHFSHDVILVGLGSGRLTSVTVASGYITHLGLDAPVTMAAGTSYGVRCRRADGVSVAMAVVTAFGEQDELALSSPIPEALGPEPGDLFQFGEAGLEAMPCIIQKIDPGPQLTAKLTLVDAAPAVLTADSGTIPAFTSWITSGVSPRQQAPAAPAFTLRSDATVLLRLPDGTLQDRIAATFTPPAASDVAVSGYELRFRETGGATWSGTIPATGAAATAFLGPVTMGVAYDVAARAISSYGVPSDWTQADPHTVVGKSAKPGNMPWASFSDGVLRWGTTDEQDLDGAIWRWQPGGNRSWGDANPLHDGKVQQPYRPLNMPSGQVTLLGKLVDVIDLDSVDPVAIVVDLGDPIVANVVATKDCHADGFTGTRTNATVDGGTGDLMATVDADPVIWTNDAAALWTAASDPFWPTTTYKAMTYEDSLTVAAIDAGAQLTIASDIAAGSYAIDYRRDGAAPMWSDDLDPFWTDDAAPLWIEEAWQAWPGSLAVEVLTYLFRIRTSASAIRGRIAALAFQLDVPDMEEQLYDVALIAAGSRLPITKSFRHIAGVHLTLQADGGTAVTVKGMDKSATLGPLVQGFNSDGTGVAAHVDATVQGY